VKSSAGQDLKVDPIAMLHVYFIVLCSIYSRVLCSVGDI